MVTPEGFVNQSTFYLAWIITIATVGGFLWQGLRWLSKKMQNDRIKAIAGSEARHQATRDFVEQKTAEAMNSVTNQTNIINTSIKYQENIIRELKESTDSLNEKVSRMNIKLAEHTGIFSTHEIRIDKLEDDFREIKQRSTDSGDNRRAIM